MANAAWQMSKEGLFCEFESSNADSSGPKRAVALQRLLELAIMVAMASNLCFMIQENKSKQN